MEKNFFIISALLSILLNKLVAQSNESNSEENNFVLKRSLGNKSLRDLLATRSLDSLDSDIKSFSDLVKRQDANKSKVSDTFLKTLLKLSPSSVSASKPFISQDLSSILNTSDFEDEEIFKKSQALGLSIKKSVTTSTTSSTSSTSLSTTQTTTTTTTTKTTRIIISSKDEESDAGSKDNDDDDEDDDYLDAEKPKLINRKLSKKAGNGQDTNKLSSKQLKQIYKFLRKKEKKTKKKNSLNNLLGSLLSSPNYDVHLKLRDSLAAKAANDALQKWHSKAPFASLNQLEQMYNKFYELYYDYFDMQSHDHYDHFYGHHHRHHHHHPHHDHHHLNLLDFLASKNENSDEIEPKNSIYEKIVDSDYLAGPSVWNDYHHTHYPGHHLDHYHDYHDYHNFHDFYDHYDPYHDNAFMPADFDHHHHQIHDFQTHFNNPNPHHHYHYSQHPVYDDYGRKLIYTTGQLERFPPSSNVQDPGQSRPVVCTNYPDHSSEGFKSFISVESCNQPSFLGSNGVPLFGNGCVFKYMCELGYQPIGGITSSIKCNNGFWTARAICIKQFKTKGIGSNQSSASLLKRSDQNLSESDSKRSKRSNDHEENSSEYSSVDADYDQLINSTLKSELEEQVDTTSNQSVQNSSRQSLILSKLVEKFDIPTSTRPDYASTSTNSIDVDPAIDWSNIIDSDSEKTIYESFYELLENDSSKLAQNLDLFDLDKF